VRHSVKLSRVCYSKGNIERLRSALLEWDCPGNFRVSLGAVDRSWSLIGVHDLSTLTGPR